MKIKVCGITSLEQMHELQQIGVDYAGMIFYEPSKRYAESKLNAYKNDIRSLAIDKVGVFVNATIEEVEKAIVDYALNAVQLHGDETDEYCLELMDKVKVIKVFRIADQFLIDELVAPYHEVSHYYLFDTDTATYGGSGKQFNWNFLKNAIINKPFFLSGGIGADDIEKVREFEHSYLYGIDINSRFEIEPGLKDMKRVTSFVKLIKN